MYVYPASRQITAGDGHHPPHDPSRISRIDDGWMNEYFIL